MYCVEHIYAKGSRHATHLFTLHLLSALCKTRPRLNNFTTPRARIPFALLRAYIWSLYIFIRNLYFIVLCKRTYIYFAETIKLNRKFIAQVTHIIICVMFTNA